MKNDTDDVASLSYEDARDQLIAIVAKLETGSATLDESLGLWERGEALAVRCQDLLDGARSRITEARGEAANSDILSDADAGANSTGDAADAGVVGYVPTTDAGEDISDNTSENQGGNDVR